jgi:hypothetical protein
VSDIQQEAETLLKSIFRKAGKYSDRAPVRIYFVRAGHFVNFEVLKSGDDKEVIKEAHGLFETVGKAHGADGFEIWDGARFVYCWP